jgi:2-keto-3-deoxy-L-rhamnonate aldolase RhmA
MNDGHSAPHYGPLRRKLSAGDIALCMCFVQARTADYPLMAAACGFDAIYVDLEHTSTSLETASTLCIAALGAGMTPLVRVPSHDYQYLTRAVDIGAVGVIVPHVNSAEEAAAAVAACKFPPVGRRSVVASHATTSYRRIPVTQVVDELNRETIVIVMLETPVAIDRAAEIAAVPGVDMILLGAYDLSAEMGILGRYDDEAFGRAVETAAAAARQGGVTLGIAGISDNRLLQRFVALGARFISAGTDASFFMEAASARVAALKALDPAQK